MTHGACLVLSALFRTGIVIIFQLYHALLDIYHAANANTQKLTGRTLFVKIDVIVKCRIESFENDKHAIIPINS